MSQAHVLFASESEDYELSKPRRSPTLNTQTTCQNICLGLLKHLRFGRQLFSIKEMGPKYLDLDPQLIFLSVSLDTHLENTQTHSAQNCWFRSTGPQLCVFDVSMF